MSRRPRGAGGGIQVINVPDYCVEEVATHAAALMLAAWRRIPDALNSARPNAGGTGVRSR